ncbi:hypothetical protein CL630_00195 [bacterium]|nr:hypothetical protein [bacterium]|tara:strand:+ start:2814 stop:3398 length:585 start_codon:yes stop_codon:yes gene_type:complete
MVKKTKEPLCVALGKALQKARRQEGKRSDELAADVGLSASLWRLIEAGTCTLTSCHALSVVKALPYSRIEFTPLAVLLTAIEHVKKGEDKKEVCSELVAVEPSLRQILLQIGSVSENEGANLVLDYIRRPSSMDRFIAISLEMEAQAERLIKKMFPVRLSDESRKQLIPIFRDILELVAYKMSKRALGNERRRR